MDRAQYWQAIFGNDTPAETAAYADRERLTPDECVRQAVTEAIGQTAEGDDISGLESFANASWAVRKIVDAMESADQAKRDAEQAASEVESLRDDDARDRAANAEAEVSE